MFRKKLILWNRIRVHLPKYQTAACILIICSFLSSLLAMIPPYLFSILINSVIGQKRNSDIPLIFLGYIVTFFSTILVGLIVVKSKNKLKMCIGLEVKTKLWTAVSNLSNEEYEEYSKGDLKVRLDDDTNMFFEFLQKNIIDYSISIISIIIISLTMFVVEWRLAIICLILIPLTLFIGSYFSKKFGNIMSELRDIRGKLESWLCDTFMHWQSIKIMSIEYEKQNEYEQYIRKECELSAKMMFLYSLTRVIEMLKNDMFIKLIIYGIGGVFIINGSLVVGSLFMFVSYFQKLFTYIELVNSNNIKLENDIYVCEKVLSLLEKLNTEEEHIYKKPLTGNIVFNNVSYRYKDGLPFALSNVNFEILPHQIVLIKGRSGAGKSTLIKLLTGQQKATKGDIRIDGYSMDEILTSNLRNDIGVVQQETKLFNLPIMENMRLASEDVTEEELDVLFKKLDMFDFISSLENKYDTIIGEKGVRLSGGQRQRIAIARVLLQNTQILIFDEATSNLDGRTETNIYDIIQEESENKTIIFTTHRLSTVNHTDKVLEICDNQVISL